MSIAYEEEKGAMPETNTEESKDFVQQYNPNIAGKLYQFYIFSRSQESQEAAHYEGCGSRSSFSI